jgi:hypothetical protein
MADGARARVEFDWVMDGVRIMLGRATHGGVMSFKFDRPEQVWREPEAQGTELPDDHWLRLPDDIARALYEALAEHYGHSSTDTRHLRMDYDNERARVDKMISYLTAQQPRG